MRFTDKVIWVTGASSGIGEALAIHLASQGASLILSARRQEALQAVAERCQGAPRVEIIPLDLGKPEALAARAELALERMGRVDILVNNGGISQRSLAAETDWTVDERIMRIDYLGTVALTKAVLPHMLERGSGQIAVVTSVMGKFGSPMRTGYAGAKHALHGFFGALRTEVAPLGIDITLVVPGFVQTQISLNALTKDGSAQGTMDQATAGGIPADECARRMADAIHARKREVVIAGSKERLGLFLARFAPGILARQLQSAKVT